MNIRQFTAEMRWGGWIGWSDKNNVITIICALSSLRQWNEGKKTFAERQTTQSEQCNLPYLWNLSHIAVPHLPIFVPILNKTGVALSLLLCHPPPSRLPPIQIHWLLMVNLNDDFEFKILLIPEIVLFGGRSEQWNVSCSLSYSFLPSPWDSALIHFHP